MIQTDNVRPTRKRRRTLLDDICTLAEWADGLRAPWWFLALVLSLSVAVGVYALHVDAQAREVLEACRVLNQ